MRFTVALSLAAAVAASLMTAMPAMAQGAAAGASSPDLANAISSIPPCFLSCASTAATAVGCKGLTQDLPCVCASKTFAIATQTCINSNNDASCKQQAANQTAVMQNNQLFMGICKAIGVQMPMADNSTTTSTADKAANKTSSAANSAANGISSAANATSSAANTATKKLTTDAAAGMAPPSIGQIATVAVVLTAMLVGVSSLV